MTQIYKCKMTSKNYLLLYCCVLSSNLKIAAILKSDIFVARVNVTFTVSFASFHRQTLGRPNIWSTVLSNNPGLTKSFGQSCRLMVKHCVGQMFVSTNCFSTKRHDSFYSLLLCESERIEWK